MSRNRPLKRDTFSISTINTNNFFLPTYLTLQGATIKKAHECSRAILSEVSNASTPLEVWTYANISRNNRDAHYIVYVPGYAKENSSNYLLYLTSNGVNPKFGHRAFPSSNL